MGTERLEDRGKWSGGQTKKFDMDDITRKFNLEERIHRHRCVETWSMVAPWTRFPLRQLIEYVDPRPQANYVRFVSFDHIKVPCVRHENDYSP